MKPYFEDGSVTLWLGDMREVIPQQQLTADLIVTDPPYGETSLRWDRWPPGWLATARVSCASMWCFGSLRMFMGNAAEFAAAGWKLSQDVIGRNHENNPVFGDVTTLWVKHNGSGFRTDVFRRVHEWASHWYADAWADTRHEVPTTSDAVAKQVRRKTRPPHMGAHNNATYTSTDGGPRLMRSVLDVRSMHGRARHRTEKPVALLTPMIEYGCPPAGLVLDPFAGSGSTAVAARLTGRRAVLIEQDESECEKTATFLQSDLLAELVCPSGNDSTPCPENPEPV